MTFIPDRTNDLARAVIGGLIARRAMIVTAESCTGGLIAAALTSIAGSSEAVYGGFVTYANAAKTKMVSVRAETLAAHGAVSSQTALEMAKGARKAASVDYAIAVTGIAGPGGGSAEKPIGLVWFGLAGPDGTVVEHRRFGDIGRDAVRQETVRVAFDMILAALEQDTF